MAEEVRAEIVASVLEVVVSKGDQIGAGDILVLLESMKMEIPVLAEVGGTITEVSVAVGDVIQAGDAEEALQILHARSDVGVLFTDVNMPGNLDGLALSELVHRLWPDIKLVVTSGRALVGSVPDDGEFLPKPYRLKTMTDMVARVSAPSEP